MFQGISGVQILIKQRRPKNAAFVGIVTFSCIHQSAHEVNKVTIVAYLNSILLLFIGNFVIVNVSDEIQWKKNIALPFGAQFPCLHQLALNPVGFLLLNDLHDLLGYLIRVTCLLSHDTFQTHAD